MSKCVIHFLTYETNGCPVNTDNNITTLMKERETCDWERRSSDYTSNRSARNIYVDAFGVMD